MGAREPRRRRRFLAAVLALSLLAAAMAAVAAALLEPRARRPPDQGAVHFLGGAKPAFERFIAHRDPRYGAFLRRHMRRMVAFSPHFDSRTRWYPNAWVYHRKEDGSRGIVRRDAREKSRAFFDREWRDLMRDIREANVRRNAVNHRLADGHGIIGRAEIGHEDNR